MKKFIMHEVTKLKIGLLQCFIGMINNNLEHLTHNGRVLVSGTYLMLYVDFPVSASVTELINKSLVYWTGLLYGLDLFGMEYPVYQNVEQNNQKKCMDIGN